MPPVSPRRAAVFLFGCGKGQGEVRGGAISPQYGGEVVVVSRRGQFPAGSEAGDAGGGAPPEP